MIQLGEKQTLEILKKKDFGVYVIEPGAEEEGILLPKKYVPEDAEVGQSIEVFVYRDSSDRMIATTLEPKVTLGQIAMLEVKEVTPIGAFLDWGLEKDLLLPYKEQIYKVKAGDQCLIALYIDKSSRLCGTMKIYDYLTTDHDYEKDQMVRGYIYQINDEYGAFVAVDRKYHGMVPRNKLRGGHTVGSEVEARVIEVREDGKMELSLSQKIDVQMDLDGDKIMALLDSYCGVLPFTEKATPEVILRETGMSKASFKRAVGRLLKNNKIQITDGKIRSV